MIFGEVVYFCILAATMLGSWLVPPPLRKWTLAVSGVGFYAYYAGNDVWLLLILTLGSWLLLFSGIAERRANGRPGSPPFAALSIAAFVGILIYFKYRGFFTVAFGLPFGTRSPLVAPLAISFFIFEFIHVAAERWKGTIRRISLGDYCAFIFFFPTMIAGPIKRYPQFAEGYGDRQLSWHDALEGITRIVLGMVKKMVIADNLNTLILEAGLPSKTKNVALLTSAILLYGIRIYLDFSGYSDIAIGSARLLGFRVPENFLRPYRQSNIASFWRHWHVSLYSWLIDYVFIPLGGSRGTTARACLNIVIVMLISGLWHGAAWNFVLWGFWHGLLLAGHKLYTDVGKPHLSPAIKASLAYRSSAYTLTMGCVWFGWLLFMWPIPEVGRYLHLLIGKL